MADDFRILWQNVERAVWNDPVPLLVCADYCDEQDKQSIGYALRWCAGHKRRPSHRNVKRHPWHWIRQQYRYGSSISKVELSGRAFAVVPRVLFDVQEYDHWRASFSTQMDAYRWLAEGLRRLRSVVEVPAIVLPPAPVVVHPEAATVMCAQCGVVRDRGILDCWVCKSSEVK
jgi:hypothetical protein